MRKLVWLFLFVPAIAFTQVSNPSIITVSSSPSGNACVGGVPIASYYAGTYYGCDGTGHYAASGGAPTTAQVQSAINGQPIAPSTVAAGTAVSAPLGTFNAVAIPSDGVHAQNFSLIGQTTNPAIPSNSFGWIAPLSASFTSYFLQPPATAPSGAQ